MSRQYAAGFNAVRAASKEFGEHRDCSVRALVITTGKDYAVCHAAMKRAGRKNRKGANLSQMFIAANTLGFAMNGLSRGMVKAKTMRTIPSDPHLMHGNYIVAMSGHVGAVVDGEVIDHSEGGLRRVQKVYQMTPIDQADQPAPKKRTKLPKGSAKWQAFSKYTKHDQLPLI